MFPATEETPIVADMPSKPAPAKPTTYRFVGAHAFWDALPSKALTVFGQKVEMSVEQAHEAIVHRNMPFVPDAQFSFTDEELKANPYSEKHENAPESFKQKKAAVLIAAQEYRASLIASAPAV